MFDLLLGIFGILLEFVLLGLLLRGPFNRYFPLFLFVLTQAVQASIEGWVYFSGGGIGGRAYFNIYWGGELMLGVLQMILVISLTMRALEGNPMLPKLRKPLAIILLLVFTLPFLVLDDKIYTTKWNNGASQILNFGAALINLGLWTALISNRRRDPQLLMVSAGLGVALASAAMTMGMREFTDQDSIGRTIADYAHRLLQMASIVIWCWAFRPAKKPVPATAASGD